MKTIGSLLSLGLLAYGGICVLVYLFQDRLIFFPDSAVDLTPDAVGLPWEEGRVRTLDGENLLIWHVLREHARGVVLFFHGNAGNRSHRWVGLTYTKYMALYKVDGLINLTE